MLLTRILLSAAFVAATLVGSQLASAAEGPNILWLTSEDNGAELGSYGDRNAVTPNLDALAARSMRFTNVWSNAPVCAPARTALITGIWPPSIGAQHMRSEVRLPAGVQMFPQLLREAGYYCTNNSKEDYNAVTPGQVWDESSNKAHWRNRRNDQPFFSVFNSTLSHESQIRKRPHKAVHDPADVDVPGYHPDLPEVRQDWAQYYDQITAMDAAQGEILKQLEEDGLADSTIIFYFGDHGSGMPRGKRWLYQSGLHVPLLIHVPEKYRVLYGSEYQQGSATGRPVSFIDFGPTVLSLCRVEIPGYIQGSAFAGPKRKAAARYLFGFRDRMDERYDCSRAVTDGKYLYIRNWMPHRPQGQFLSYMFETPTTTAWLAAARDGELPAAQEQFWRIKPVHELYDLAKDPDQVNNIAAEPRMQKDRDRLSRALLGWMVATMDLGLMPEAITLEAAAEANRAPGDLAVPFSVGMTHRSQVNGEVLTPYPITRIFKAFNAALDSSMPNEVVEIQLADTDAMIRYWTVIGLHYRGLRGDPIDVQGLLVPVMGDREPCVVAAACEAVARLSNGEPRKLALERLGDLLNHPEDYKMGAIDAMMVFDALLACNPTAEEIPIDLAEFKRKPQELLPGVKLPQRYGEYLPRSAETIERIANDRSLVLPLPVD